MEGNKAIMGRLDKTTLDTIRAVYRKSAKIVAVKVFGFPEGKVGYVKEVLPNGNVKVVWDTGDESEIIYGKESIRAVETGKCILGYLDEMNGGCDRDKCEECGWNRLVSDERQARLRDHDFSTAPDGTKCLKVVKKKSRRQKDY